MGDYWFNHFSWYFIDSYRLLAVLFVVLVYLLKMLKYGSTKQTSRIAGKTATT
jgi:hypothetical protein